MSQEELINTTGGGFKISASMINAVCRGISVLYDLGRALGTAIRMSISGRKC